MTVDAIVAQMRTTYAEFVAVTADVRPLAGRSDRSLE